MFAHTETHIYRGLRRPRSDRMSADRIMSTVSAIALKVGAVLADVWSVTSTNAFVLGHAALRRSYAYLPAGSKAVLKPYEDEIVIIGLVQATLLFSFLSWFAITRYLRSRRLRDEQLSEYYRSLLSTPTLSKPPMPLVKMIETRNHGVNAVAKTTESEVQTLETHIAKIILTEEAAMLKAAAASAMRRKSGRSKDVTISQKDLLIEFDRDPNNFGPRLTVFSGGTAFNHVVRYFTSTYSTRIAHILPISDNGGSSREICRVLGGGCLISSSFDLGPSTYPLVRAVCLYTRCSHPSCAYDPINTFPSSMQSFL
jgi:hypothetical protein